MKITDHIGIRKVEARRRYNCGVPTKKRPIRPNSGKVNRGAAKGYPCSALFSRKKNEAVASLVSGSLVEMNGSDANRRKRARA